jgi:hypothetical protein
MTIDLVFTTSAVITAIGVIVGGIIAIYRVAQKIQKSIGLDSKGRTISERLDRVEHQLWENGGSSLADRVNTIETHVIKTNAEMELIKEFVLGSKVSEPIPAKRTRLKKAG